MMAWITSHWKIIRLIGLLLLLLGLLGPWGYDRVNVPVEFDCQDPYIRLEGEFCGLPISGLQNIAVLGSVLNMGIQAVSAGEAQAAELGSWLLYLVAVVLTLAPIAFLVLWLIRRQPSLPRLHSALSILVVLLIGFFGLLQWITIGIIPLHIWGLWLYVGSVYLFLVEKSLFEVGSRNPRST
jgi:hypothetical protein